ncbi:MAG TPA: PAS domain S-box protein [Rhodocyclaceae bacterium]|nr:PAS domain S-box protein [Rhodocyclaceae bacterium]
MGAESKRERWLHVLLLALGFFLAVAVLFAAKWEAERQKVIRMESFRGEVAELARAAEAAMVGRLRQFDDILLFLRASYLDEPARFSHGVQLFRHGLLADEKIRLVLIDRSGRSIYSDSAASAERVDRRDAEYFRHFSAIGGDRLHIDAIDSAQTVASQGIALARPIVDKRGEFAGVLALSLPQDALTDFGARSDLAHHDVVVTVTNLRGDVLVTSRNQAVAAVGASGRRLADSLLNATQAGREGVLTSDATLEGGARIVAYRKLDELPLMVLATALPSDVLHETTVQGTVLMVGGGVVSTLVLVLLSIYLQRRKIMAKLIETQRLHLQEAQRIAGMGSWELDLATLTFHWSPEVYRLFGVTPDAFSPTLDNFLALVPESGRAAVRAAIKQTVVEGRIALDHFILRGDGQLREMVERGELMRDESGEPIALVGTVRDVTERRAAARALVQSEEKFRSLARVVPVGIFHADPDGRMTYVNEQFTALSGCSGKGALGRAWLEAVHIDDRAAVQQGWQHAVDAREPWSFEFRFQRGFSRTVWVLAQAQAELDEDKSVLGFVGSLTDITERREQEERIREAEQNALLLLQAVEHSPVSIVITDRHGAIQYVNPGFTRISGYSRQEAIGGNPRLVQSGETPAATYEELWRTLLSGQAWQGILRNRRKDGVLIWEEMSISPIVAANGEVTHFVAVKEDVTERVRNQQQQEDQQVYLEHLVQARTAQLSEALEAAKSADQAKDAFLATVNHELRTPLNAVIGMSALARRICTDQQQRNYLDKVISAGKTLTNIINDLLDLSKIVAGRMELEIVTFSLRQLLKRSSSVMYYKAEEKGLELIECIDEDVPDVLIGAPLRIEQILLNLLGNAIKFTAHGQVAVRIHLVCCEEQRVCLALEIEDTGVGITDEEVSRLFVPFSQADASMSRRYGGTGLGLAISKRLVEMMDGEIGVLSRKGVGTTFRVTLWLGLGKIEEIAADDDEESTHVYYHEANVLVVDDQPFNREVAEALLTAVGIAVRLATNGQEALDLLAAAGPDAFDVVLMDVQMPVMDGLSASRELRARCGFAELPIVAITAHTMSHEKERSLAAGMNDHIGKPFDNAEFYRVLAKWVPAAKQQQQSESSAAQLQSPAPLSAEEVFPAIEGVDIAAGLTLLLGDASRYRHWLLNFAREAPAQMETIRQAVATNRFEKGVFAAHILKGRSGMLGMKELHRVASELEAILERGVPDKILLERIDEEIKSLVVAVLGALKATAIAEPVLDRGEAAADAESSALPMPDAIAALLSRLEAGDADCDTAIIDCLADFKDSAWLPRLQQALIYVQNFDFDQARRRLSGDDKGH